MELRPILLPILTLHCAVLYGLYRQYVTEMWTADFVVPCDVPLTLLPLVMFRYAALFHKYCLSGTDSCLLEYCTLRDNVVQICTRCGSAVSVLFWSSLDWTYSQELFLLLHSLMVRLRSACLVKVFTIVSVSRLHGGNSEL